MAVRASDNQSDGDVLFAVEIQELQGRYADMLRRIAGRWEQGLRTLVGLVGVTGLLGAPLAAGHMEEATRIAVGVLLFSVLVLAIGGLLGVMSAAYGSTTLHEPRTHIEVERLRYAQTNRDRSRLIWGRRLAITALALFSLAVAVVWLIPSPSSRTAIEVTTDTGHTHCGALLDAPEGTIVVHTDVNGVVQIPVADIAKVRQVDRCKDDQP